MKPIGKAILRHRKRLGLSQYSLAKKMGVTRAAVQMWERDRCDPGLPSIILLLKALMISFEELVS